MRWSPVLVTLLLSYFTCTAVMAKWYGVHLEYEMVSGLGNFTSVLLHVHRRDGQVVWRPPRERQTWVRFFFRHGSFSGSSHTSDLNIGTPVAALPGAWRVRVSAQTGWPGISIL